MSEEKRIFPVGKIPLEQLDGLLKKHKTRLDRVIMGPGIGRDAAVIDFGQSYLVAKTDPITFATDEIGYYAVNINANDIVCTGAVPKWLLTTLLLPEGSTNEDTVDTIMQQITEACKQLQIGLVGGHTEITYGIDRPIVIGQMLGEVSKEKLVRPEKIEIGDLVLLTKGIAVEATSILAREKEHEIRKQFGAEFVERAREFLYNPGISVRDDALLAMEVADVHAFHDPTEGGVATGLLEVARAGLVGLRIEMERIPFYAETEKLCSYFKLDPLGVIASGALIIVTSPVDADPVAEHLRKNGIPCEIIGEVVSPEQGITLTKEGKTITMPEFDQDEITKVFSE